MNGIRIAKVGFNLSLCFALDRPKTFLIMRTNIYMYVFFILSVVWKTTVWKLPGGYEENRGSIRLVLSLYLQHQIRL